MTRLWAAALGTGWGHQFGKGAPECEVQLSPHPMRKGLELSPESTGTASRWTGRGARQAGEAELGDLREGRSKHASKGLSVGSGAQLSPH